MTYEHRYRVTSYQRQRVGETDVIGGPSSRPAVGGAMASRTQSPDRVTLPSWSARPPPRAPLSRFQTGILV
jgi:hypothetical protein